jgi:hypothetical protein
VAVSFGVERDVLKFATRVVGSVIVLWVTARTRAGLIGCLDMRERVVFATVRTVTVLARAHFCIDTIAISCPIDIVRFARIRSHSSLYSH